MPHMTTHEIIDETVAYYSKDVSRRAVDANGDCTYLTRDGRRCAVGRCIPIKAIRERGLSNESAGNLDQKYRLNLLLKKKYRGHSVRFWDRLQHLHDEDRFWHKNGLTTLGLGEVRRLKEEFPPQQEDKQ